MGGVHLIYSEQRFKVSLGEYVRPFVTLDCMYKLSLSHGPNSSTEKNKRIHYHLNLGRVATVAPLLC